MWRFNINQFKYQQLYCNDYSVKIFPLRFFITKATQTNESPVELPTKADVIIIGGGSAGCHTLYHLAKRGVKAVLLECAKLTAGTTWHTAGLVWRLRPNDVEIQLLNNSRNMLLELEQETGLDPGWTENGGVFIAHTKTRLDEYKRLASVGNALGIENYILTPSETQKVFPLLNPQSFVAALYSPGDGVVDPAMLCNALTRSAIKNGAKVFENTPVDNLLIEMTSKGKRIVGVSTPKGTIRSEIVINAAGVWGRDLIETHGSHLPLIPMKHAYIVTESIPGVRGLPNIRDHDYSIYFRIQGDSIQMGGYEHNPILLDRVPKDFHFGLYDLDWSIFEAHLEATVKICPSFINYGIKSTICGPESFTPDHKPLMGPDPIIHGLYHNCAFNSAGMMFGGGCGEQIALWIVNGKPDLPMFSFDLRRFTASQCRNEQWLREKSHESYAKNYSLVFKHDQAMAGRNYQKDPLHDDMLKYNAFMEERGGWERAAFFLNQPAPVRPYDWCGSHSGQHNTDAVYKRILQHDLKYNTFSHYHHLVGKEALACRNNAVIFNLSYLGKMFMEGPQAQLAAEWLFVGCTNVGVKKAIYTCSLNHTGGVEACVIINPISLDYKTINNSSLNGQGYYIVTNNASAYYTCNILLNEIRKQGFEAYIRDATTDISIISIQGRKSREILQKCIIDELTDDYLPPNGAVLTTFKGTNATEYSIKLFRISSVGELGYELHIPSPYCSQVYNCLMELGKLNNLINAGCRALNALSCEKGYHLWNSDLRTDDTPVEANLPYLCRESGSYKGKEVIERQKYEGVRKRLIYLILQDRIPMWGLEGVYRNNEAVGFVRRAEFAYYLGKPVAHAYIQRSDNQIIDDEFAKNGEYEIDVLGKRFKADCYLKSPFDPQGERLLGIYS